MVSMDKWHANNIAFAIDFAKQLQEWLNDAEAQAEYQEWSAEVNAQSAAEKRAEAHELAKLGEGALHCIAGHDIKWQQGGD